MASARGPGVAVRHSLCGRPRPWLDHWVRPALLGTPAWLLVVVIVGGACSDKSKRLSEKETLDYKRELLQRRGDEISFADKEVLYYHPGRTTEEIDKAFAQLKAKHDREVAAERAAKAPGKTTTSPDKEGGEPGGTPQPTGPGAPTGPGGTKQK